jgi:branched-chain amino acid transport system permease protein
MPKSKKQTIGQTVKMSDPPSTPIQSHFISTPRLRFHVRQHGPADGIPMLLIHGTFATSRWWEPLMAALPEQITAIAPDLRGAGQSDHSATGYEIEEQAEDLAALVNALGWQDFELVAHSSGGAIAIEYILTNPEMARTLTLVDTVPIEGAFTPLDTYMLLDQMRSDRELLAHALAALMPSLNYMADNSDAGNFFQQLVDDAQQMAPAAYTAIADALNHWNRFGDGRNLRLPTLLIWGDRDIIVDRDATTRTLIAIPGAHNLEVLRDIGHSPMIEAPALLAERITDFITEDFDDFEEVRRIAHEEAGGENAGSITG